MYAFVRGDQATGQAGALGRGYQVTSVCSPAGDLHQPDGHRAREAAGRGVQGQGGGCGGETGAPLSGVPVRESEGCGGGGTETQTEAELKVE